MDILRPPDAHAHFDALQESAQRLRETIDSLPALVYTMAPAGQPEFFNRPFLEYFGKTPEEMMDWARIGVIHPDDLTASIDVWQRAVATGRDYSLEFRLRRADGVFRWFELRSRTVDDPTGRIVRSYGVLTDIEDRRQIEDALRASEQHLRTAVDDMREIVDRVPGLVYTMTPEGDVELVNHRILEYFGRPLDDLQRWAITDAVHPNDLARVVAAWRRAVDTGGEHQVNQRLRRADGVYRWFRGRSLPVRDAGGRIVRWYGLLTDVDDEKRTQRRLRRAMRARYEAVLAERMRIARDMHDGLLQDITALGLRLGAALPHIRSDPDAAADRVARILDDVQRVNRAARDAVLAMRARTDADDLAGDLVEAVHAEARRVTARSGLALSVRVSGPTRFVPSAVRDAALSIVQEALTNVIKHAGAHGVRVTIAFRSARIRVSVQDDGDGMNAPSDSAHATTKLGLVGMRERATSIGGELCVSTAPGRGTKITLDLALADDESTKGTPGSRRR